MGKWYKKALDTRVTEDNGFSGKEITLYVLEEQRELLGIKYWTIMDISFNKDELDGI